MGPAAAERFIRRSLALKRLPDLPSIRLHVAHAGSGLRRLGGPAAPYWAYPWPGGIALARHFFDNPAAVEGRRVLDLGCGGGLVGIAAAQAGAAAVVAADIDPLARVAARLNAEASGVSLSLLPAGARVPPEGIDLVAAGDVFYAGTAARRVTDCLLACRAAGIDVLVGDPGRDFLPRDRLTELARYPVTDFAKLPATGFVFAFDAPPHGNSPIAPADHLQ